MLISNFLTESMIFPFSIHILYAANERKHYAFTETCKSREKLDIEVEPAFSFCTSFFQYMHFSDLPFTSFFQYTHFSDLPFTSFFQYMHFSDLPLTSFFQYMHFSDLSFTSFFSIHALLWLAFYFLFFNTRTSLTCLLLPFFQYTHFSDLPFTSFFQDTNFSDLPFTSFFQHMHFSDLPFNFKDENEILLLLKKKGLPF